MSEQTPMEKVLLEFKKYNFDLSTAHALEVFGRKGDWHTKDYAPYVSTLEVWEINPEFLNSLKENLPNAEVKITNSFNEVKITPNRFDLIVVDNPQSVYGNNDEYCEHFELFPYIFRIANDSCVFIINVNVEPYNFHEGLAWWERRSSFYKTDHPEKLERERERERPKIYTNIYKFYENLCKQNGFDLKFGFFQKRNDSIYYFVFNVEKVGDKDIHANR